MNDNGKDIFSQNKVFAWLAAATVFLLCLPLIAMQSTQEVDWTVSDFIIMGILIFGMGSLFVLAARRTSKHRMVIGTVVLLGFLYIWVELAVGIFTNLGS